LLTLDPDKEDKNPKVAGARVGAGRVVDLCTYSAPDRWERGRRRLPLGRPAGPAATVLEPLVARPRGVFRLQLSRSGGTFVFSLSDGDRPADRSRGRSRLQEPHAAHRF
jgi:hypothetical protein